MMPATGEGRPLNEDPVQCRRAIEALRSGVPNRDAVLALGADQPGVEAPFRERLAACEASEEPQPGLVLAGVFGTGKSHTLEHLRQIALDQRFVCSKIAVSKEMPIFDLPRSFRLAASELRVRNRIDPGLSAVAESLDFNSPSYSAFYKWVNEATPDTLDPRFAATLYLYEYVRGDDEFRERIRDFWSGQPLNVTDLRRKLTEYGQSKNFRIGTAPRPVDLARQRLLFAARLVKAAGYAGWLVLIDEVELISSYSRLQRARSYGELARWGNRLLNESTPGMVSVMAITSDVVAYLFEQQHDRDDIPNILTLRNDTAGLARAETGMRIIERDRIALRPPDDAALASTYARVRSIYSTAYGREAPDVQWPERLGSTPIREYVRYWIEQWDLQRAYPGHTSRVVVTPVTLTYGEDPDIADAGEGELASQPEE